MLDLLPCSTHQVQMLPSINVVLKLVQLWESPRNFFKIQNPDTYPSLSEAEFLGVVCDFSGATRTKYHNLSGLETDMIVPQFCRLEAGNKVLAGSWGGEGIYFRFSPWLLVVWSWSLAFLGLQKCSTQISAFIYTWCSPVWVSLNLIPPFYKDTCHLGLDSTQITLS